MFDIINFLESNKEWLFDGLGAAITVSLVGFLAWIVRIAFNWFCTKNNIGSKQIQNTGDTGVNFQIGDNSTVNNYNIGDNENVK